MGLLKMFKSSSGSSKSNASASASGSTSLPPTPLYPAQSSPAPSRSSDRRREYQLGALPYEAMEQGRIPRAGPSARSSSSASAALPPLPPSAAPGLRSVKSSTQSNASGRYEDPPEHDYRAPGSTYLLQPGDGRIRHRASSEVGPGKEDRSSFILHDDLSRDYLASLSLLNSSPPILEVGLPPTVEDYHESPNISRPPSPRIQRPPPLLDPASFRQNVSDTLPTASRSRSPQPSLAQSERQPSSGPSAKEEKAKRGMFGIKAFGGRGDKQASGTNRQLPEIPVRRDSRDYMTSPPRSMRELVQPDCEDHVLEASPARASIFETTRRNSGPVGHARQNSDSDLLPPPPLLEQASHSAPASPRDGGSMRLPDSQPFPTRTIELSSPELHVPSTSSVRSTSNGFPWLANATRSRSKSPGPSRAMSSTGLDTLGSTSLRESPPADVPASTSSSSGILGHMPAFGKVRSRSRDMTAFATLGRKSDDKTKVRPGDANSPPTVIVPLPDSDNDPSFQLRSFRHVSSGSGMAPGPEISYVPANPPQTKPRSVSRPTMSRPGSTLSMHDDSTDRKISVQKFRHSRRFSTNSVTDLQLEPVARISTDDAESHEILLSPTETVSFADQQQDDTIRERPARRESAMEMLVSPVKTRSPPAVQNQDGAVVQRSSSASFSNADDSAITQPETRRNPGFVVTGRKTSRSSSRGPVSPITPTKELPRRPTVNKHRRPTLSLSPEQRKVQTETWCAPDGTNAVTTRARHVVSQPSSPRSASSPRALFGMNTSGDAPKGARSPARTTVSVRSTSPTDSTASSSRQRLPLHARLASVTLNTGPSSIPDPACEIPPVKTPVESQSTQAATAAARMSKPPANGHVKPVYTRSVSTTSQHKQGAANTTWVLSSSDEDSDEIPAADAQRLRRNFSKVRTSSMPSGLRRPPSTAEAFGSTGMPPVAPLKTKSASSAALSSFVAPPPASLAPIPVKTYMPGRTKGPSTGNKLAKPVASSSESEASRSSSEDEALSKVAQRKASSISLASAARKQPPPMSLPPLPLSGSRKKVSSEEEASTSPTSSTRTTTPGKLTPLRSTSGPIVRHAQLLPKLSMGLPVQSYAASIAAISPLMGPPIRPFGYALAGRVPRESPSSSQSGTGDTSSSGAPLTPRDGSSGSDIGVISSNVTESGRTEGGKSIHDRGGRGRRVSFVDNDWSGTGIADAEAERKRKERRREEAKQAIEVGRLCENRIIARH